MDIIQFVIHTFTLILQDRVLFFVCQVVKFSQRLVLKGDETKMINLEFSNANKLAIFNPLPLVK